MKPGPWGCVIRSGAMSSRSGAPAATSKLPLSGGIGTTPWSSTRSTSSVFRSSSTITPSTGCAHSLSPGAGFRKATARHSRWPVSSCRAEVAGRPGVHLHGAHVGHAAPRHRRLEIRVEQHSLLRLDQLRDHRHRLDVGTPLPAGDSPSPTATVASTVSRADRSRITTSASRSGSAPPCSHSSTRRLSRLQQRDRDEAAVLAQGPPGGSAPADAPRSRPRPADPVGVSARALVFPHTVS